MPTLGAAAFIAGFSQIKELALREVTIGVAIAVISGAAIGGVTAGIKMYGLSQVLQSEMTEFRSEQTQTLNEVKSINTEMRNVDNKVDDMKVVWASAHADRLAKQHELFRRVNRLDHEGTDR